MKLTELQCRQIIGGLLGALCSLADPDTIRQAIAWWHQSKDGWQILNDVSVAKMKKE